MLRIFLKKVLGGNKSQILFYWSQNAGQNGGRLGDVTEAGRPVLRGLEVILEILRFGGNFCGDHGASAPPSLPLHGQWSGILKF